MPMTLVSTVTLTNSTTASMAFSNIPQTGKDLLVLVSSRSTSGSEDVNLLLNGSSSNFTRIQLRGSGSTVSSNTATSNVLRGAMNASSTTASTFSNAALYISNYTSSANKSISQDSVSENNAVDVNTVLQAITWANTAAITSLTLNAPSNFYTTGTTASLYVIN